jgi:ligand-binding SRPBCC domain-containing protein
MHEGTEIEYRLKIHGIPARWRSRITVWDPPYRFVDEQLHGPYRVWIHEHRFTEDASGTMCEDRVEYAPLGGTLINKLLVERDVRKIFEYRSGRLKDMYGLPPVNGPQKVA